MKKIDYNLGSGITAFSTLRGNIVDWREPYDGFNVCHYCGASDSKVEQCRRELLELPTLSCKRLIIPDQTHSTNVAIVRHANDTLLYGGVDALVTDCPDVVLCINTADCVPILIADPKAGIVAAVHSGWRGTVGLIAAKAVEAMLSLGASPQNIKAVFGPSICANCFEVGEEVADIFRKTFHNVECVISHPGQKSHVDLHKAITATLINRGLETENIIAPQLCSHCNPNEWFSARRLGIRSGRTLSAIAL